MLNRMYNKHMLTKIGDNMITEKQVDRIVEAIEGVSTEIADNSTDSLAVDDYNLISSIWEALDSIANTLKKIEAKM